jgi:hypothetical protein
VLDYSALRSRVAFSAFALTVVVASNLAQVIVSRIGARATLTIGLLMFAASVAYVTRLPVDGNYFVDLFPAFVIGGAGMGFSFVPITISALAGVHPADAGIASGLVNTSRQIGGAIGLAATGAIAAASTSGYLASHPALSATSAAALDHGFQTALLSLTGLLLLGAAVVAVGLSPSRSGEVRPLREGDGIAFEEAA